MTSTVKLLEKFLNHPDSLRYREIEKLLIQLGFEKNEARGSHKKFKHPNLSTNLIIPVNNNDCKTFYKNLIAKIIKTNFV